ncbi:hypothetical protein XF36_10975 [Pseudonocardia sp. HH130629-09]|nr:hypothetical protein XF36_10975 [Pseudonocardia sp. HH130629-09]
MTLIRRSRPESGSATEFQHARGDELARDRVDVLAADPHRPRDVLGPATGRRQMGQHHGCTGADARVPLGVGTLVELFVEPAKPLT